MSGIGDAVLDELRLDPSWSSIRARAISQALAHRLARELGVDHDAEQLAIAAGEIWNDRGVNTRDDLQAWMDARALDETRVRELIVAEAMRRWGEGDVEDSLARAIIDQLQLSAEYPALLTRATRKRALLARKDLLDRSQPLDIEYQQLLTWCVGHRPHLVPVAIGQSYYENPDAREFLRAVINEYHYVTRCGGDATVGTVAPPEQLRDDELLCVAARWS